MRPLWQYIALVGIIGTCAFVVVKERSRVKASRSLAEEAREYRLSVQHGDANAEEALGGMYYNGRGVPQNDGEAFHLYQQSAEQGNVKAQFHLGTMYELGRGVQQDFADALLWYRKAADLNEAEAECSIGSMYYHGEGVQQDLSEAIDWYRRAAGHGSDRAEYNLGYLYDHGQGAPKDLAQAYYWYRKAAAHGYDSAEQVLGLKSRIRSIWSLVPVAMLFACLWILKDFKVSTLERPIWDLPTHDLAALLGLIYSGMGIYRLLGTFHSVLVVDLYCFTEYLFLGAALAVAFYVLSKPPRTTIPTLIIIIALLAGINTFVGTHQGFLPYTLTFRELSSIDGILVGIIIFVVASLWTALRIHRRPNQVGGPDARVAK